VRLYSHRHRPGMLRNVATSDNLLFFGCRSVDNDFHYKQEWEKMVEEGSLVLSVAASRDQVRFSAIRSCLDGLLIRLSFAGRQNLRTAPDSRVRPNDLGLSPARCLRLRLRVRRLTPSRLHSCAEAV
jgi:hypothetical protein